MKSKYIKYLLLLSMFPLAFSGCKTDSALDLNVSRVETLYEPESGKSYDLDPQGSVIFYWSKATAADGGLVVYEVVFDKPDGDFSNPVYRIASDDKGVKNSAAITHKLLNKAAAAAGAQAGETITLKWCIASSKGDGTMVSQESRTITVKRLDGFADIPPQLYMAGDGAEAKQQFKSASDGEFEIFTRLKAGTSFSFADGTTGTPQEYSINNGTLVMGGSSTVSKDGIYKINVDFNSAAVTYSLIEALEMFFPPRNNVMATLDYQGSGVWMAKKVTVEFNGGDERYKFRFLYEDGNYEWYGSKNYDNQRPTADTNASYYDLLEAPVPSDTESLFAYTYKFNGDYNGANVDVTVKMQAQGNYTHTIEPAQTEGGGEEEKYIPNELYITGSGAESERAFTKLSDGIFEMYTKLNANRDFGFADALSGDEINRYSVNNGVLIEKGTSQVAADDVYKLTVNFNAMTVNIALVTRVELYFAPTDNVMFTFDYAGQGEWKATNVTVTLKQEDWGKDERYKFRVIVNGGLVEWYGSSKADNGRPNPDEPPSYFYMFLLSDKDRWVNTYKFSLDLDGKNIDMSVRMNGDNYTHEITKVY